MADIIVNTRTDEADGSITDGDVSLRDAIALAESGDRILFDANTFLVDNDPLTNSTIDFTLGDIDISQRFLFVNGDINSDGIADVTLNGALNTLDSFRERAFDVSANSDLLLEGLKVENFDGGLNPAEAFEGGAVRVVEDATLRVLNSSFDSNTVITNGGGAIANRGTTIVANSTFSDNSALFGGAVFNSGDLTVLNSTFVRNEVEGTGGAISTAGGGTSATLTGLTITGNTAGTGGGIRSLGSDLTIENSIIAGNGASVSGVDVSVDEFTDLTSNGGNIFGETPKDTFSNDLVPSVTDLRLDASTSTLEDVFDTVTTLTPDGFAAFQAGVAGFHGGPGELVLLKPDGQAINKGLSEDIPSEAEIRLDVDRSGLVDANPIEIDQAGQSRSNTTNVDAGAIEAPQLVIVSTAADEDDGDYSVGDLSLREAIRLVGNNGQVEFDGSLDGQVLTLDSVLTIDRGMTIDGKGQITISGDTLGNDDKVGVVSDITDVESSRDGFNPNLMSDNQQIFNITNGPSLLSATFLKGLTLTGGTGDEGGAIRSTGQLSISDSTISGSASFAENGFGGAIYATGASLIVRNTTFSGNQVVGDGDFDVNGGGAIFIDGSANDSTKLTIYESTIENNKVTDNGGGIQAFATEVKIVDSTIRNNTAESQGGGIHTNDTLALYTTTINNNTLTAYEARGGGIYANGGGTFVNSSIVGNALYVASDTFEPRFGNDGAGLFLGTGTFDIHNSTITSNTTFGGESEAGGAT